MKYSSAIHFCVPLTLIIAFRQNCVTSPLEKKKSKKPQQKAHNHLGEGRRLQALRLVGGPLLSCIKIHYDLHKLGHLLRLFYIFHQFFNDS